MKTTTLVYQLCLMAAALLSSCVQPSEVIYLQSAADSTRTIQQNYNTIIQKDDILSVHISSKQPELAAPFHQASGDSRDSKSGSASSPGYLVDRTGCIVLPIIGKIHAAGKSTSRLGNDIAAALKKADYIRDASVNVKILNFKFSVLGEVNNPGVHTVTGERITLLEAISMAGDLSIDGNREVTIIRECDGKRRVSTVDLRSPKLFDSPYYYIRQNDVIYVSPGERKINTRSDTAQWYSWGISGLSMVIAVIALACC